MTHLVYSFIFCCTVKFRKSCPQLKRKLRKEKYLESHDYQKFDEMSITGPFDVLLIKFLIREQYSDIIGHLKTECAPNKYSMRGSRKASKETSNPLMLK